MEDAATYHHRRANEHRKMAARASDSHNAQIHTRLAGMHEAAAVKRGHKLTVATTDELASKGAMPLRTSLSPCKLSVGRTHRLHL